MQRNVCLNVQAKHSDHFDVIEPSIERLQKDSPYSEHYKEVNAFEQALSILVSFLRQAAYVR